MKPEMIERCREVSESVPEIIESNRGDLGSPALSGKIPFTRVDNATLMQQWSELYTDHTFAYTGKQTPQMQFVRGWIYRLSRPVECLL